MPSFFSGLASLLLKLFSQGSSALSINNAEALLAEATAAWLKNLALVGVKDGARFVADARALSAQVNAQTAPGGAKRYLYLDAVRVLLVELGGDLKHTLVESITRTAAELFHQPDAGVPPVDARLLGSTSAGAADAQGDPK